MSDEDEIRRTIAQYAHFCDDGRFDEWSDLYTDDATFSVMGQTHKGREAIKDWIVQAQPREARGKHVCINTVIDTEGDEADAWTDFVFITQDNAVSRVGRYHDRLVKGRDRWRFLERRIVFMGDEA
jgi:uncharacterized protein (TIGR02246 family)